MSKPGLRIRLGVVVAVARHGTGEPWYDYPDCSIQESCGGGRGAGQIREPQFQPSGKLTGHRQ